MKTNIKKFGSITEYVNWQKSAPVCDSYMYDQYSQLEGRMDFAGTESWDEAQALLIYGDKELAAKIEHGVTMAKRKIFATKPRTKIVRSVGGFMPNIPAYLSGAKKDMFRLVKQPVRQRVITVVYNSSINCGTTIDEAITASVSLLKAVMSIEASGLRVNLYNSHFTCSDYKIMKHSTIVGELIKIKDSGQYIDTTKMAYPLISPSMHRRHHFRTIEALDENGKLKDCYGYPVQYGTDVRNIVSGLNLKNAYCVSYYDIEGKTPEQIVDLIYNSQIN